MALSQEAAQVVFQNLGFRTEALLSDFVKKTARYGVDFAVAPNGRSRNCAFFAGCLASITFTPTGYKITELLGLLAPDTETTKSDVNRVMKPNVGLRIPKRNAPKTASSRAVDPFRKQEGQF